MSTLFLFSYRWGDSEPSRCWGDSNTWGMLGGNGGLKKLRTPGILEQSFYLFSFLSQNGNSIKVKGFLLGIASFYKSWDGAKYLDIRYFILSLKDTKLQCNII